ncbi:hypothetical protein DCC62_09260 [candidate division KSB1 bacterium]|nr:MAG: hypothetical protein DCC62_09260 [candidate division KSB1 bacterium]
MNMSPSNNEAGAPLVMVAVNDLFMRSKINAVAQAAKVDLNVFGDFNRLRAQLSDTPALVLINLGELSPQDVPLLAELLQAGHRVIGFLSHVEVDLARVVRATGCEVMPRSEFFERLPEILLEHANTGAGH